MGVQLHRNNRTLQIIVGVLIAAALIGLASWFNRRNSQGMKAQVVGASGPVAELSGQADPSFARAMPGETLHFPEDQGPHPDYQTEWWYYTGNLETPQGRRFGYQLTFFRRAMLPPALRQQRESGWATDQAYMAHFAVSDISGDGHLAFERLSRGAAGLAGAQANPFGVWLEDWSVEETRPGVYRLHAEQDGIAVNFELAEAKPPVLHGLKGYSQKGPEPGNASYYYSLTRLISSGEILVGGSRYPVNGLSWMDHEYSTSALPPGGIGWDWFSLQLSDNSELMVFQIRHEDGTIDPFSSGTWIAPDGTTRHLNKEDFSLDVSATWRSPETGAIYPSRWTLAIASLGITLELEPLLADQELNVSYSYWEGAVTVRGRRSENPVKGYGYVELTGYH